jgi:hypothetical protein
MINLGTNVFRIAENEITITNVFATNEELEKTLVEYKNSCKSIILLIHYERFESDYVSQNPNAIYLIINNDWLYAQEIM